MRRQLIRLRDKMREHDIDIYVMLSTDAHASEYIDDRDRIVEYISGFTGDNATMIVSKDKAWLWTDGRYFIQAQKELSDSGIELMKMGEEGVPMPIEVFAKEISDSSSYGYDDEMMTASMSDRLDEISSTKKDIRCICCDLISDIWEDRPSYNKSDIYEYRKSKKRTKSIDKLAMIRSDIDSISCDALVTGDLSEIAWMSNLRGADIAYNPLFRSYMYIDDKKADIFIDKTCIACPDAIRSLENIGYRIYDISQWFDYIKDIKSHHISISISHINSKTYNILRYKNDIIDNICPISIRKMVKDTYEISDIERICIEESRCIDKALYDIKDMISQGLDIDEIYVADYIEKLRKQIPEYLYPSFPTIAAYGSNAAMCHYIPTKTSSAKLQPQGLLLIDTGGQYTCATTDMTRTIALGPVTDEMKRDYTLTVVAMLRLMNHRFPSGTKGYELDHIARDPIISSGIDYNHATGHGIGCAATVHEGPIAIRKKPSKDMREDIDIMPGMILSDEPGIYREGSYGIRIENQLLCTYDQEEGYYTWKPLTRVRLEDDLIDRRYMTDEDINAYNRYQKIRATYKSVG